MTRKCACVVHGIEAKRVRFMVTPSEVHNVKEVTSRLILKLDRMLLLQFYPFVKPDTVFLAKLLANYYGLIMDR